MKVEGELKLHSPLTQEEFDLITDAEMEHTTSVKFTTKGGKEVKFVKILPCSNCKYALPLILFGRELILCKRHKDTHLLVEDPENSYCSFGETK